MSTRPAYFDDGQVSLHQGDAVEVLAGLSAGSVNCVVTSPPYYGLRDYGVAGQLGLETTPDAYVDRLVEVFAQVRRVLAPDGTLWLNLGDGYASSGGAGGLAAAGLETELVGRPRPEALDPATHGRWLRDWGPPAKNLLGMPWRVAFALQTQGWIIFSGSHRSSDGPGLRVSAAQRLLTELYGPQQAWCKHLAACRSVVVSRRDWGSWR